MLLQESLLSPTIWILNWILPVCLSVGLWLFYRKLVVSMERRLAREWRKHRVNLFPVIPNYTAGSFRIAFVCYALTCVVVAFGAIVVMNNELFEHAILAAGWIVFAGYFQAVAMAGIGYYVERRLLQKLSRLTLSAGVKTLGDISKVGDPMWAWGFRYFGKSTHHWPYTFNTPRGKRVAYVTKDAVSLSTKGVFVDTWPQFPKTSTPVFVIIFVVSNVIPVLALPFSFYAIPLLTKNLYVPMAAETKRTRSKGARLSA